MEYGDLEHDNADDECVFGGSGFCATNDELLQERFYEDLNNHEDDKSSEPAVTFAKDNSQFKHTQTTPSGSVWGPKTDPSICCWWCCHTFKTTPVSIPCKHDEMRNTWKFFGIFCSASCARAYNIKESRGGDMGIKATMFTLFMKKQYGLTPPFVSAPSRQSLKMFGGPLTITQFRKMSKTSTCELLMPPHDPQVNTLSIIPLKRKISKQLNSNRPIPPTRALLPGDQMAEEDTPLKLQRKTPPPKKAKGSILKTMNISVVQTQSKKKTAKGVSP